MAAVEVQRQPDEPAWVRAHWAGTWADGGGAEVATHNPARHSEVLARFREANAADVDDAVRALAQARHPWARRPIPDRCRILKETARLLEQRAERYGAELSREEGKVIGEAIGEVRRAASIFAYYGAEADRAQGQWFAGGTTGQNLLVVDRPVGVVAAVTPWNFPIAIPSWKIAPALAFGNPVIWKPSPLTPLLSCRLLECLLEAGLPPDVLAMMPGGAQTGMAVVTHPDVDAVTFTGSTAAGRVVVERCAALGRPVQAETGGHNAVIVAADADLERAVRAVVVGAFSGNGEKCTATARVIVEESVADRFRELLAAAVAGLRVGPPTDPATDVGPLISADARGRLQEQVATGLADATVVAEGTVRPELAATGWFVPPLAVELSAPAGEFWHAEIFGPVVVMYRAASFDAALELANDSPFGLAGAVHTRRLDQVHAAVERFEVGMLSINEPTTGGYPYVPFGGWKASGAGPKEQGAAAREFYSRSMTVHLSLT
ncbi:aldehyde dehydrogenase family protein [Phytoactinopolyspora limicola]|uniref:aldehyde dehydrogenase family protein n=1 Tax=Phytoactinopolyspora limicola TaxID=2715536 RepID=UPI00140DA677|nr:aldehyde dehydrogenase family protein [Phytoactinopolyspora limicola]